MVMTFLQPAVFLLIGTAGYIYGPPSIIFNWDESWRPLTSAQPQPTHASPSPSRERLLPDPADGRASVPVPCPSDAAAASRQRPRGAAPPMAGGVRAQPHADL